MKRRSDPEKEEYKKGVSIETNLHQIIAIVVIFLAMFVLPIQAYNLYQNSKTVETATYTGQVQGVQNEKNKGNVLGAFDSIIPSGIKEADGNTSTIIIFVGAGIFALAGVALLVTLLKK